MRQILFKIARILSGAFCGIAIVFASAQFDHRVFLSENSYAFTKYVAMSYGVPAAIAVLASAALLGLLWKSGAWLVAIGFSLVPALAASIEMARDKTSHNLIPLEIILYWLPIFIIAWVGAAVGMKIRVPKK